MSASKENQNTPRGLLGNFNGNPGDDLSPRDSSSFPVNSSHYRFNIHSYIHYSFGMSWNVSASESLFTYPPGRNHSSFQDPTFVPSFRMPAPDEVSADARAACNSSRACLFDFQATGGNVALASGTARQEQRVKGIADALSISAALCPPHSVSSYSHVTTTYGHFNGSIAQLNCVLDSSLQGYNITKCENGSWSPRLGDCIPPPTPKAEESGGLFKPPWLYVFIGCIALIVVLLLVSIGVAGFIMWRRSRSDE